MSDSMISDNRLAVLDHSRMRAKAGQQGLRKRK